ncbi:hypothetical protein CHS0354_032159 [Potamilus streckersoni]|uniref:BTB domain-containing protein n=1 Tax=Potamilus streckersoni TaxID=2493646 RepID=A0AAE0TI62_9BIVA|nr:hypothetical protein CHS0354_032159 [Potamilus streckersoni]
MVVKDSCLSDDMRSIISVPELCDIIFLVGPQRMPVYGLRAILSARSRIFGLMIASHQTKLQTHRGKNSAITNTLSCVRTIARRRSSHHGQDNVTKLTIPIEDFEPDIFEHLMTYVHAGTVTIEPTTVVGLLNAAQVFGFTQLYRSCLDFVLSCIPEQRSMEAMLISATHYYGFKSTKLILKMVKTYMNDYPDLLNMRSRNFRDLTTKVLSGTISDGVTSSTSVCSDQKRRSVTD